MQQPVLHGNKLRRWSPTGVSEIQIREERQPWTVVSGNEMNGPNTRVCVPAQALRSKSNFQKFTGSFTTLFWMAHITSSALL
jgi:hypothetical protein